MNEERNASYPVVNTNNVPEMFRKCCWDILICPEPLLPESHPMYNCSRWINMNVLMWDEEFELSGKNIIALIYYLLKAELSR